MRAINLYYPSKISVGTGCIREFAEDVSGRGISRIFVLTFPEILPALEAFFEDLRNKGFQLFIDDSIRKEPGFLDFERVLKDAGKHDPELVLGIGGGSVLDVAKLLAAQLKSDHTLDEIIGINCLSARNLPLACIPTTSGTGSEVSPNTILLDERIQLKKAIISSHLVPDMCYVDPELTMSVPPAVTAATGIDAFTHCLEAYVNKVSHPAVDTYALNGMRLIYRSLEKAYKDGNNIEARADLSLGSLYGGLCLGPVNTTAVHALAYPLGSESKIAHGLTSALLLPYVMEYNLSEATSRFAEVAKVLGVKEDLSVEETAVLGVYRVKDLISKCGLPARLSDMGIPKEAIRPMAESAMTIQRLLKNNPREIKLEDAVKIYTNAH